MKVNMKVNMKVKEKEKVKEKKLITMLLMCLVLILGFTQPVLADEVTYPADIRTDAEEKDYSGKLILLHTNDVHGSFDGYAKIAALAEKYRDLGAEVILVDAGDFAQGSIYTNLSKGADAITLMNEVGYQYAALGNHEFDFSSDRVAEMIDEANFTILCADLLKNGEPLCPKNAIFTAQNGVKIGLFGLDTPEIRKKTDPKLVQDLTIPNSTEMHAMAEEQVDTLRDQGAQLVIALTHLGVNLESAEGRNRSIDLYETVPDIDFIIDGHSHTVMTEGPYEYPIQSTGTKFENIGVVIIGSDASIEEHFLISTDQLPEDSRIKDLIKQINDDVDAKYDEVIGEAEVTLDGVRANIRTGETNCSDFVTDAMYWDAVQNEELLDGFTGRKVALTSGGSIRASVLQGDVTKKDIYNLCPYGNILNVVYITGNELLELLEASTFASPATSGGFPQTKGIKFTIDTSKPFAEGPLYPKSEFHKPAAIRRVTIEEIEGSPFDPDETYAVIVTDFLGNGGDQAAILADKEKREGTLPMDQILEKYMLEELGGTISKEKYENIRGDVSFIYAEDGWLDDSGKWYYFKDHLYSTGWLKVKRNWYYFDAHGVMQTGWIEVAGKWYYLTASGAMKTGWLNEGNKWYYLSSYGEMQTGWIKSQGKWYYMAATGAMKTGWLNEGDKWYHLSASGEMQTGWIKSGGYWYFFDETGAMAEGWKNLSGTWYYLEKSTGRMVTGQKVINGITYEFSSTGALIEE